MPVFAGAKALASGARVARRDRFRRRPVSDHPPDQGRRHLPGADEPPPGKGRRDRRGSPRFVGVFISLISPPIWIPKADSSLGPILSEGGVPIGAASSLSRGLISWAVGARPGLQCGPGIWIILSFPQPLNSRRSRESRVVAVPKRRKSKSAKGNRRSHDFLVAPALNTCPQCKLAVPPHKVCHLVEECGNIQRSKPHNPTARDKGRSDPGPGSPGPSNPVPRPGPRRSPSHGTSLRSQRQEDLVRQPHHHPGQGQVPRRRRHQVHRRQPPDHSSRICSGSTSGCPTARPPT